MTGNNITALNTPTPQAREKLIKHREWIGGRVATLMAHYWRESDTPELKRALGKDWMDVLAPMSQQAIQKACVEFQRCNPMRRPTPAAIYGLAKKHMPPVSRVKRPAFGKPEKQEPRCVRETAQAIVDAAGFGIKRFEQPTPMQEAASRDDKFRPGNAEIVAEVAEKFADAPAKWKELAIREVAEGGE